MSYYGDFIVGSNIKIRFNTRTMAQVPSTFSGSPALAIYKDSTTESSSGISLTVDYDGRTGLNYVEVDTTADAGFYVAGKDYDVVVTAGTVDGISVVGEKIATFSMQNRCVATVTGNVGGNVVGNVNGTVGSVTGNVGGNVVGNVNGTVGSVFGNVGGNVVGNVNGTVSAVTGDVGGNVVGNVNGTVSAVTGDVGGNVVGNVNGTVSAVTGDVGGDVNGDVVGAVGDTRLDDIKKNTNLIPALLQKDYLISKHR